MALEAFRILVDLVKDDDRVIHGEGQDGEQTNDDSRGNFEAKEGINAGDDYAVCNQCNDRGESHVLLQANGHVDGRSHQEDQHGNEHALGNRRTPGFGYRGRANGVRGGLAVFILRLEVVIDSRASRIHVLLAQALRNNFQGLGIASAHDVNLLGFYTGGVFKDLAYLIFLEVACRHRQRGAAFEVNRERETTNEDRSHCGHDKCCSDAIPQLGATDEVITALVLVEAVHPGNLMLSRNSHAYFSSSSAASTGRAVLAAESPAVALVADSFALADSAACA